MGFFGPDKIGEGWIPCRCSIHNPEPFLDVLLLARKLKHNFILLTLIFIYDIMIPNSH